MDQYLCPGRNTKYTGTPNGNSYNEDDSYNDDDDDEDPEPWHYLVAGVAWIVFLTAIGAFVVFV
jgi:hypothetical protein